MITIPKYDIEKLINDLVAMGGDKPIDLKFTVRVDKLSGNNIKTYFTAETGLTITTTIFGQTPEALVDAIKANMQQLYLQLATSTQKISGKAARDRVRYAAGHMQELLGLSGCNNLQAFNDGDFVFCYPIERENTKKVEESLKQHGWNFEPSKDRDGGHWGRKPLPGAKMGDQQHRISMMARIGPIPTSWPLRSQNGQEAFEFWFDTMR